MKNNYIEAGDNDLCLSRARQWIFSTLCTIWSLLQLFNRALKYVMQEHTTEVRNVYVHSYSWGLQPLFSVIDRMNRLKNQQRYRRLNTAHHLDLIDIYRTFHWAVHMLFHHTWNAHQMGTFWCKQGWLKFQNANQCHPSY